VAGGKCPELGGHLHAKRKLRNTLIINILTEFICPGTACFAAIFFSASENIILKDARAL
jgi:hypothetical protein